MAAARGFPRKTVLILTVAAAPGLIVAARGLGDAIYPPEMGEVRALLAPTVTTVAWCVAPLALVLAAVGWWLQGRVASRLLAKLPPEASDDERVRARFGAFFLGSCIPQLPALAATLLFMIGAETAPVGVVITLATVAVAAQGVRAW